MFSIERMRAADLAEIRLQRSQQEQLGQAVVFADDEAEALAAQPVAWTVRELGGREGATPEKGRVLCCMAIAETFPGRQGVAMALFAQNLGSAHLGLTRWARRCIAESPLPRVEAIALANDAEAILARFPDLDPWELLHAVMVAPPPPCRWALAVGLTPVAVLRKFGGAGQTHVLFERIG